MFTALSSAASNAVSSAASVVGWGGDAEAEMEKQQQETYDQMLTDGTLTQEEYDDMMERKKHRNTGKVGGAPQHSHRSWSPLVHKMREANTEGEMDAMASEFAQYGEPSDDGTYFDKKYPPANLTAPEDWNQEQKEVALAWAFWKAKPKLKPPKAEAAQSAPAEPTEATEETTERATEETTKRGTQEAQEEAQEEAVADEEKKGPWADVLYAKDDAFQARRRHAGPASRLLARGNGKQACEGHSYGQKKCEGVGCCEWKEGKGCVSAVGTETCDIFTLRTGALKERLKELYLKYPGLTEADDSDITTALEWAGGHVGKALRKLYPEEEQPMLLRRRRLAGAR